MKRSVVIILLFLFDIFLVYLFFLTYAKSGAISGYAGKNLDSSIQEQNGVGEVNDKNQNGLDSAGVVNSDGGVVGDGNDIGGGANANGIIGGDGDVSAPIDYETRHFCNENSIDDCSDSNVVCGVLDSTKVHCDMMVCVGIFENRCAACKDDSVMYWTYGDCSNRVQ